MVWIQLISMFMKNLESHVFNYIKSNNQKAFHSHTNYGFKSAQKYLMDLLYREKFWVC